MLKFARAKLCTTTIATREILKRPGVLDIRMVKIEYDVVFSRGKCKLPDAFYGIKNIDRS